MEIQEVKEQLKEIFRTVINNDKWITIHPNGEDGKGRHLLLKDGETPKEAIDRTYGDKKESKKKFETHYIVWQKNGEPYILDKTSFENWKENNKEHISTTDIDYITHSDIEKLKKDAEARGIDVEKEGGENYLISQIADLKKEDKKQSDKQSDSKDDELVNVTEDYYNRISEDELKKEFKDIQKEFAKWKDKKNFPEYKDYKNKLLKIKDIYEKRFGKQSDKQDNGEKEANTKQEQIDLSRYSTEELKQAQQTYKNNLHSALEYGDEQYNIEKDMLETINKELAKREQKDNENKQSDRTIDDKIKEHENKIPKNYRRDDQTKALWLYKNDYITRSEWEKVRANNSKEQDMALLEEIKKLITRVENNKENEMEIENEKVDKRDIIRQIMAIAGKEEASEEVKTIAKLAEKLAYDKSEAGTADNEMDKEDPDDEKEVKEVKKEVKEDVENKCKNSVDNSKTDYFAEMNKIYNAAQEAKKENIYISQAQREQDAVDYFKK